MQFCSCKLPVVVLCMLCTYDVVLHVRGFFVSVTDYNTRVLYILPVRSTGPTTVPYRPGITVVRYLRTTGY